MSPPTFEAYTKPTYDVNVKMQEPIKDYQEKPEPMTPEEPVTDTGTKCRRLLKKRCGCCRGCKAFVVLLCVVVITAGVLGIVAIRKHFHLAHKQLIKHEAVVNGRLYPEVYEVDYDHSVIKVRNAYTGLIAPADILSDYRQKMKVYKDTDNKVCYIDALTKSFEESLFQISAKIANPPPPGDVITSANPIEDKVVKKFAGKRIAKHCKGMPAYWIVDVVATDVPAPATPSPLPPSFPSTPSV
ncbi:hypothetical protein SNE40_017206 [Patella caerulea]|uniref:BRICHOS domain-containing protein n=1 Tax=Patella caerulea TaxID=87958 RepID=A0AAN8JAN1_PATCE